MGYVNHIFVSYRRENEDWRRWTLEMFVPALEALLPILMGKVEIFVDQRLNTGVEWPKELACELSRSRVLIPLLSVDYFDSPWCCSELRLMLKRQAKCRKGSRVIFPVVLGGEDRFPLEVSKLQSKNIHEFALPSLVRDTPKHQDFQKEVKSWCPELRAMIEDAPDFDKRWETPALRSFQRTFSIKSSAQRTVPRLSLQPLPTSRTQQKTSPPRRPTRGRTKPRRIR